VASVLVFHLSEIQAQVTMNAHGWVTLESYVHGQRGTTDLNRSHRSEFTGIVDLFTWRWFTMTFLLGNTTDISRNTSDRFYMDRVIYTYTYGGRLDLNRWVIRADYHHDCIHLLNRPEISGSTWWNAFQLRAGSRGSFYLYVPADYDRQKEGLIGNLDARVSFSAYREAGSTLRTGQNHNYRFEYSNLTRLHIGKFNNWILFADQTNRLWITWDGEREYKGEITLNALYRAREHYAGFYYEYHFPDNYEKDPEDRLGSIGFRILF